MAVGQDLTINSSATADQMAPTVFGGGVTVVSASYTGDPVPSGIWINGQVVTAPIINIAQFNSINQSSNETLFVNNTADEDNTEMDGFTVTLSVLIPVNTGVVSTLVLGNDGGVGLMVLTHINGVDVRVGDSVTLSSGHQVALMPDGTLQITPPASLVNLTGPVSVSMSCTVENADGIRDTALVSVSTLPSFTPGTRIRTDQGEVPVERLSVGDLVETRDNGLQPIRRIGRRRIAAVGPHAPVAMEAGVFGNHGRPVVSPQHRVLLTRWMCELKFGQDEVLIAARDLVNDCSVRMLEGGKVTYIHLLFDQSQILRSEGWQTKSVLPGPEVMSDLDDPARAKVLALCPDIDAVTHEGYGPAASAAPRSYEARVLGRLAIG